MIGMLVWFECLNGLCV